MKPANTILSSYGTTVFEVMSRLAVEHGAINLGQGFPDGNGPGEVVRAAAVALEQENNQYPPMLGIPGLRKAVAAHAARFYGLEVDWRSEVLVTSGATEALASCLFGLIEPGDEVVLIEPLYDSYLPIVRRAGGVPKLVRVEPPGWTLPRQALEAAFSSRTKLLLLNSPMNPAGKVFSLDELEFLARLVREADALAICDEVYEHITFDDHTHIPLMTLPEMRGRCLRIGSAGKTFSLTGWKVGYVTAAPELLAPVSKAHQFLVFTTPPNLQHATAFGLGLDDSYYRGLAEEMRGKRDRLWAGLEAIGFQLLPCDGTYFLNAGFAGLGVDDGDEAFCRRLTVEGGVTPIPVSAFYQSGGVSGYLRFCFSKDDAILDEALTRLARYFGGIRPS